RAQKLSEQEVVKAALQAIVRDEKVTIADQIAITEVEAPPFHEKERGLNLIERFKALGLTDVTMDPEGNVIAIRRGTGNGPLLVLGAHQDTVFPAGTDVKVKEIDGVFHGPGISDDARGLAVILQVLRTMQEFDIQTVGDLYFVCTVGEEGNGDLRGSKYLFHKSGLPVDGFISVDGADVTRLLSAATGSKRYRVHFDGPGGHSWKNFGLPSAIHAMGRAIAKVGDVVPCADPKTTYTCGTISGGTTVNSIAAHCEMELDMRSAGAKELDEIEAKLLPLFEEACREENARWGAEGEQAVKLTLEPIGHRPGGQQSDDVSVLQASRAAMKAVGIELKKYDVASTDHNIAINCKVPATTLGGGGTEGYNHNVKEWWDPTDSYQGPQLAFMTSLLLLGLKDVTEPVLEKIAR
ncbi:MAG: M20/M25/M40 family metallo-hydrolase, partial [Sutterellaceae bacterium]|nr:M20/M25/M40 family metallo-hydrolase [Sutterellaceae bacterium]